MTTWPEDLTRQRSDCHAWGSLPLYEFPTSFLGVRPLKPGWKEIEIRPEALYINDMKGSITTPEGTVSVSWEKDKGMFKIKGDLPEGVTGVLVLPDGSKKEYPRGGLFTAECKL